MQSRQSISYRAVGFLIGAILIAKVTLSVLWEYRNYLPPNFQADFLLGREEYFWGCYAWAFYIHIASGPPALVCGLFLVSRRLRAAFPQWHRRIGRLQVANVVLLVAPSGLWMAFYALTGTIAAVGLAALAIATAVCITLGWRNAVRRQFHRHEVWMQRTVLLLSSAVVIRLIGGAATVLQLDAEWIYPFSVWTSWVAPLAAFELRRWRMKGEGNDLPYSG
jgi:hypothetical protein